MPPRFAGVDHLALLFHDLDAAAAAFGQRLGLPVEPPALMPEMRVRVAYVDLGNIRLQLLQPLAPGPLMDRLLTRGEGLDHLCLTVDGGNGGIHGALAALAPGQHPAVTRFPDRQTGFLPEPIHGLRIELVEYDAAPPAGGAGNEEERG